MKDLYYILGVDENCTLIEIKEAYRKLSKKFHPDLNQNDKYFESRFREIQEAYETLGDPLQRARYNNALKNSRPGFAYQPPPKQRPRTTGIDIGFTIILIIITCIFGAYVINAVSNSNTHKVNAAPVISTVAYVAPLKHHKRRHPLKIKEISEPRKVSSVTALIAPNVVETAVAKPAPMPVTPIKPAPEAAPEKSYLYATNVRSNLTGVINMHQLAKFSSVVITEIPSNSKVLVLEKGSSYYKVLFNNAVGYVPKWTLEVK